MAAGKCKKNTWQKFFAFLNACYAKIHLIKAFNSIVSSRPKRLQNVRTGGL